MGKVRFSSLERREILDRAQKCLWTQAGSPGREYLLSTRHLSERIVREFGLGYVPVNVQHQLAGRIIFPIYNPSGSLVVLSSRWIDGETDLPVYWHEKYDKSFYLYGIHLAKSSMRKWKFVTVVEGQIDTIRMYDHGICNTVGLCGNKFTDYQLAIIYRYCDEIVVLLDTDANLSGQKASAKILNKRVKIGAFSAPATMAYDRKIAIAHFEENLDPDDAIKKYGIGYIRKIIKSKLSELRSNANQYS